MKWVRSKEERNVMERIADRAIKFNYTSKPKPVIDLYLAQCHGNGCPLNLNKLLIAHDNDFNHDITGILENLDRRTGKLKNGFVPRCRV